MSKYRKKPVVVEAVQIFRNMGADNWYDMPIWIREAYDQANIFFLPDGVQVRTLEGIMKGNIGDWIIKGVAGEIYPCKDEIFQASYELAEE